MFVVSRMRPMESRPWSSCLSRPQGRIGRALQLGSSMPSGAPAAGRGLPAMRCDLGPSRRQFDQSVEGLHIVTSLRIRDERSMYSGPIIDPHMHLWDLAMERHPWLQQKEGESAVAGLEKIRRNYLVKDYRAAAGDLPVVASVHIEAVWDPTDPLGEVSWLETLDKSSGVGARYVAAAPFGQPGAADVIEAHLAFPRVAGFRAIVSHHPTQPEKSWTPRADLLEGPAWRRDVGAWRPREKFSI